MLRWISAPVRNGFIKNSSVIRKIFIAAYFITSLVSCSNSRIFNLSVSSNSTQRTTGTGFYKTVAAWKWTARDSLAVQEILAGNIPSFLKKFVAVTSTIQDSTGISHQAVFYVSPDYLSIGTDEDWTRIPLTPMAAQKIADSFHCFLPTSKMVDLIYQQASLKLEPVPMYAFRDSSVTMWQHHLIIEGQRKGRKGLIAGIKKDVVLARSSASDRSCDSCRARGTWRPRAVPTRCRPSIRSFRRP